MKVYICNHSKIIIVAAVFLLCTVVGCISAPTIIAKMQPVLSETLTVVDVECEEESYYYTGEAIKPEITKIVFQNQDEEIVKNAGEFQIVQYIDNIEVGQPDIEISIDGYQGTLIIDDVFRIQPVQVRGFEIASVTRESIVLTWEEAVNADGYVLFKSIDGGENYTPVFQTESYDVISYQDTEIQPNAIYMYYVCAYNYTDEEQTLGNASEPLKQYTLLDNTTISSVTETAYNTLQIQWNAVEGAAGYQIYRTDKEAGEYQCVAEITDGAVTSYDDTTCECGRTYYYSIKVSQLIESGMIYGDASPVVSGKTTLGKTDASGKSSDNNTKVTLTWKKVSGAHGYEVYKNNKLVKAIENADTLSWFESGLSCEEEATYKVRAYCIIDNSKIYGSYSKNYEKDVTIIPVPVTETSNSFNETDDAAASSESTETSTNISVLTQYAGNKYVFGGTSPTSGWDCSGFTRYAFSKHFGIRLSRTAAEQASAGRTVNVNDRSSWQPGDLLFYKENGRISHVAVYLGNGKMIHALNSKYGTLIQDVSYYEWWDSKTSLYCVRRYL